MRYDEEGLKIFGKLMPIWVEGLFLLVVTILCFGVVIFACIGFAVYMIDNFLT